MSSPAKLLQLQNVYLTSRGKLHAIEASVSPARKGKPPRRKPGVLGLNPLPNSKSVGSLSPKQWRQWMHDAQAANISSSVFLATTSNEKLVQAVNEGLQLVLNPEITRTDEQLTTLIEARATEFLRCTTTVFTMKDPPAADKNQQWRSRVTNSKTRKKAAKFSIEPLLSNEMRAKLQVQLKEKIKGTIWENEIRSRLARPLSASTFCSRSEHLRHPLAAVQYTAAPPEDGESASLRPSKSVSPSALPRFPYSVEAHAFANYIHRCRLKTSFRVALKARARNLAIAIRVLRRRGISLLVRGFRRRRHAAIRIQRCYRRFLHWCAEFLRPFVCKNVAFWVRQALVQTAARVMVARSLPVLYLAHKRRRETAVRRASHLYRWAAKTRISLFIHQTWTECWFRKKRVCNVNGMKQELAALEASDHNIHLEYTTIFSTSLGVRLLKNELSAWRSKVQKRASPGLVSADVGETDIDPSIVRLRQCFQIFDLDGSGTLDLDEFQLMLSHFQGKKQTQLNRGSIGGKQTTQQPPKLTTAQTRTLFAELDCDGNGGITCSEFESWWTKQHERATLSTSASTNFLSRSLDGLLLQSHGLLFYLLGHKQQLERKFVKKLLMRRAMESAKREIFYQEIDREHAIGLRSGVFRCQSCGRRFGLRRDLVDHVGHECSSTGLVVDTFTLKRWVHEEEFHLLEDVNNRVGSGQ